ncbi:MAG TPA: YbdK family carboxylate-amine ligase [Solirubrobacteraceae bacterium]|jgi:carboxylate-amine ligase|nr:YbdK family carboxylate-amine ligase [Solirubrobacteraceae bacterium]
MRSRLAPLTHGSPVPSQREPGAARRVVGGTPGRLVPPSFHSPPRRMAPEPDADRVERHGVPQPSAEALTGTDHATSPGEWSRWATRDNSSWTIGVEEEVMLLDPSSWALASRADAVMSGLTGELASHTSTETHGSALELRTDPHATVADGIAQLEDLRGDLARELEPLDMRAAVAGLHPFTLWQDTQISDGDRYRFLYGSMRELARREPTFALHVHVALPDPESAVRAINRLRSHLPLLLALSANSPFWQGRETGLASARTPLFQAFPRVGIPRAFLDYDDYVSTIDLLLRCEAFPEPTFLWWDARLQPRFGTLEVRIMDAQSTVADSAALTALVQCLVRLEATEGSGVDPAYDLPEVLAENRFLAARDGAEASLIDAQLGRRSPVSDVLEAVLVRCLPHAQDLGCVEQLEWTRNLAATPRPKRQLDLARGPDKLPGLVEALSALF